MHGFSVNVLKLVWILHSNQLHEIIVQMATTNAEYMYKYLKVNILISVLESRFN